jgi:hypothetical protein
MAAVSITAKDRFTNIVEYTGATMDALDDWFEVPAESSSYTFAAKVTGAATFKLPGVQLQRQRHLVHHRHRQNHQLGRRIRLLLRR